MKVSQ